MTDLKEWFLKTLFLALKTASQAATGAIGGSALCSEVNWALVGSSALIAALTTFLMHISDFDIDSYLAEKKLG